MAKENYKFEIGGSSVSVPAWATKEQLDKLIVTDAQIIKNLEAMLRNDKVYSNKVLKQNADLLKSVTTGMQSTTKAIKNLTAEEKKAREQATSESKARREWAKKQRENEQKFMSIMKKSGDSMKRGASEFTGKLAAGLKTGSLKDIAGAIGGVVGLGTAFGAMAGIVEEFGKALSDMSSVGAGLGTKLNDLRSAAADAGLDMAKFGKVIIENSEAVNSLGRNTTDGALEFSRLSKRVRDTARQFNYFGLSNEEMNQVLAQEIELRRLSGQTTAQITAQVAGGMNNLLKETSALAALTGQDRREMLKRRQETMTETSVSLMTRSFEQSGRMTNEVRGKLSSISDVIGKADTGLANALMYSAMSGQDFRTIEGGKYGKMAAYGGAEFGESLDRISGFIRQNLENRTMTPEQFSNALVPLLQQLGRSPGAGQLQAISTLSRNDADAMEFASMINRILGGSNMGGKFATAGEVAGARAEALGGFERTAIMALPATLEEMSNNIKASALNTVLDQLAVNINNGGQELISALRRISDNFGGDRGIFEGIGGAGMDFFSENPMLGVAGAGLAGYGGYKLYRAGRGVARGAQRIFGRRPAASAAASRSGRAAAARRFAMPSGAAAARGLGLGLAGSVAGSLAADALGTDTNAGKTASTLGTVAGFAGTGAAIGSAFGGVGAIPGAIIGGTVGLGYGIYDNWFNDKNKPEPESDVNRQLGLMVEKLDQILTETRKSRIELEQMG